MRLSWDVSQPRGPPWCCEVAKVFNWSERRGVLGEGCGLVPVPLYQRKAEFFRTLGHPVRIRVLELLGDGPLAVRELLAEVGVEATSMSQQLAVLRRAGIVNKLPDGRYSLAGPDVADLMRAARSFLTRLLAGQGELLDALRVEGGADDAGVSVTVPA